MARNTLNGEPSPPSTDRRPCLELAGLAAGPPGSRKPVLTGVDLVLYPGETGVLLGGNGVGKSTLLRTAAGLWPALAGEVRIPSGSGFDPRAVGLVLEDPAAQFVASSVAGELDFALENQGMAREEIISRREATLRVLDLEPLRDRDPMTLSPGEQARCLVAAALVLDPPVLLLDDAFLYLGPGEGRALWNALCRTARAEGSRALLLATHDGDLAVEADRVGVLESGRLQAWGPAPETLRRGVPAPVEPPLDLWLERALEHRGVTLPAGEWGVTGLARRILPETNR